MDALVKRDQKPRFGIDFSTGIWDFDVYADVGIRSGEDFRRRRTISPDRISRRVDPNVADPTDAPIRRPTRCRRTTRVQPAVGHQDPGRGRHQLVAQVQRQRPVHDRRRVLLQPAGLRGPDPLPGLLFNNIEHAAAELLLHRPALRGAVPSLPAPYSWNYTTFTLSTLGNLSDMSFVSRLDYSVTLLTHLSFEAFLGVHYGTSAGEFRLGVGLPGQTSTPIRRPMPMAKCAHVPRRRPSSPMLFDFGVALRMKIYARDAAPSATMLGRLLRAAAGAAHGRAGCPVGASLARRDGRWSQGRPRRALRRLTRCLCRHDRCSLVFSFSHRFSPLSCRVHGRWPRVASQNGWSLDHAHRRARQPLDGAQGVALLAVAERQRDAGRAGARGAADAVDVALRLDREARS